MTFCIVYHLHIHTHTLIKHLLNIKIEWQNSLKMFPEILHFSSQFFSIDEEMNFEIKWEKKLFNSNDKLYWIEKRNLSNTKFMCMCASGIPKCLCVTFAKFFFFFFSVNVCVILLLKCGEKNYLFFSTFQQTYTHNWHNLYLVCQLMMMMTSGNKR